MSHISIHRLDEIARRRIGRTAQTEALPPQMARHDGSHWGLNRRPFAHATFPGHMSKRTGPEDPRLKIAKDAALAAGAPPADVDLLTLDELVITPDLVSGEIGGISWQTRLFERVSVHEKITKLVPGTRTGFISLRVREEEDMSLARRWSSPSITGPVIIESVNIGGASTSMATTGHITFAIDGVGWSVSLGYVVQTGLVGLGHVELGHWLTRGSAALRAEREVDTPNTSTDMTMTMRWRELVPV